MRLVDNSIELALDYQLLVLLAVEVVGNFQGVQFSWFSQMIA